MHDEETTLTRDDLQYQRRATDAEERELDDAIGVVKTVNRIPKQADVDIRAIADSLGLSEVAVRRYFLLNGLALYQQQPRPDALQEYLKNESAANPGFVESD